MKGKRDCKAEVALLDSHGKTYETLSKDSFASIAIAFSR